MYILDPKRFEEAMRRQGFASIGALARALGIHRNTIHHYLSGHGVFPTMLEKILDRLALQPGNVLVQKNARDANPLSPIAPLVDCLQQQFPEVAFVLFGSRARNTARTYSDWDIGAFSQKDISHDQYRRMWRKKEDREEEFPYMVDVTNLNRADEDFLKSASRGWIFLGGNMGSWLALNQKVAHEKI